VGDWLGAEPFNAIQQEAPQILGSGETITAGIDCDMGGQRMILQECIVVVVHQRRAHGKEEVGRECLGIGGKVELAGHHVNSWHNFGTKSKEKSCTIDQSLSRCPREPNYR
jgi:hypothetical protein